MTALRLMTPPRSMSAVARLGHVAHAEGNLAEAHTRYEESLVMQRRWDDKRAIAFARLALGPSSTHWN